VAKIFATKFRSSFGSAMPLASGLGLVAKPNQNGGGSCVVRLRCAASRYIRELLRLVRGLDWRLLDIIAASGVEGDPQSVFAMIEEDLRARLALPVEQ
jgi:hypothetical protein